MILKLARRIYLPLWRAILQWLNADGLRMSAAMSFYGILSLAPLLVLVVAVLGWWLDRTYIETSLVGQFSSVIGKQGAEVVKQAIASARAPSEGIAASLIAAGVAGGVDRFRADVELGGRLFAD